MASTATYKCKEPTCRQEFTARTADRKRGWAKFCSKSCKAKTQTRNTGRGRGGVQHLPNGGYIKGNTEYDRHGVKVGIRMSLSDLAAGGYGDADWDTPFGEGKW